MKVDTFSTIVAALESGRRPRGGVSNGSGTIPSLGGEHLNNDGGFRFDNLKFVNEEFFNGLKKGIIKKNDILIVKDGATTGKVSFVGPDFPYQKAAILRCGARHRLGWNSTLTFSSASQTCKRSCQSLAFQRMRQSEEKHFTRTSRRFISCFHL